jgi:hypothetical protein
MRRYGTVKKGGMLAMAAHLLQAVDAPYRLGQKERTHDKDEEPQWLGVRQECNAEQWGAKSCAGPNTGPVGTSLEVVMDASRVIHVTVAAVGVILHPWWKATGEPAPHDEQMAVVTHHRANVAHPPGDEQADDYEDDKRHHEQVCV